jgi:hypothetical protein
VFNKLHDEKETHQASACDVFLKRDASLIKPYLVSGHPEGTGVWR